MHGCPWGDCGQGHQETWFLLPRKSRCVRRQHTGDFAAQGPRTGGKVQQLKAKGSHTDLHGFCNSCKPNGASQCYRIYGTEIKAMQCNFDCTVCVETHLTLSQAADGHAHRVLELCVVPEPMCVGTVPSPSHPLSSPCSQLCETGPIVIPNLQVRKLRYKVDS